MTPLMCGDNGFIRQSEGQMKALMKSETDDRKVTARVSVMAVMAVMAGQMSDVIVMMSLDGGLSHS